MTVYELKKKYYEHNPDGHFFDRDTLRFFGERLSEMKVDTGYHIIDNYGKEHTCYQLISIQHKAPKGVNPIREHYFDEEDFDIVFPKEGD